MFIIKIDFIVTMVVTGSNRLYTYAKKVSPEKKKKKEVSEKVQFSFLLFGVSIAMSV